ncbi:MAG: hypothetical protein EB076_09325 [Flavobacteriia bacterium]|nr:hypothetical protein [Flavobacteriia bacterium]
MLKKILLIIFLIFSSNLVAEDVPFLLTAAAKGDLETVKAIIESGGSANTEDKEKLTALMYAVRKDNIEVVKYLIKKGAKVNAIENEGWTALMFAAKKGYINSAKILLENGADPKIIDPDGWSAYGLAATSGYSKMINLLIQKGGIDPNTRNNTGATVLMLACKNGDEKTIETLLKNKASSDLKDRYGKTALMYAVINGNIKAAQLLQLDPIQRSGFYALKQFADVLVAQAFLFLNKPTAPVISAKSFGQSTGVYFHAAVGNHLQLQSIGRSGL